VALIKGLLAWYRDPVAGMKTLIPFQYNPAELTRTFRFETPTGAAGDTREASKPPLEDYALTLELDATDALERGGPLTTAMGVSPQLAALEMLMQPASALELAIPFGGSSAPVPRSELPLVLFVWGPERVTPVRVTSLSITETAFDELLHPIHAQVKLSFTVLRSDDAKNDAVAREAARYYETARTVKAMHQLAQSVEQLAP
jgi:hypothetical protein